MTRIRCLYINYMIEYIKPEPHVILYVAQVFLFMFNAIDSQSKNR